MIANEEDALIEMHSSSQVKLKFDRASLCICVGDRRKTEVIDFCLPVKLCAHKFYSSHFKVQRMNWISNKLFYVCIYLRLAYCV